MITDALNACQTIRIHINYICTSFNLIMGFVYIWRFPRCQKREDLRYAPKFYWAILWLCFCLEPVLLVLTAQINVLQKENDFISHHDLEVHNLTNAIEKMS